MFFCWNRSFGLLLFIFAVVALTAVGVCGAETEPFGFIDQVQDLFGTATLLAGAGLAAPTITVNPNSLTFNPATVGTISSPDKTATVSGSQLTEDILCTVSPNTDYGMSIGGPFSTGIVLHNVGGSAGGNLTVRFLPSAAGSRPATITCSSGSASNTISLSGTGVAAPTIGSYGPASIGLGGNTVLNASNTPTGTASMTAIAAPGFKGTFAVDPVTGSVRVTNAGPAGVFPVKVYAFNSVGASTSSSFNLSVANPTACGAGATFAFNPGVQLTTNDPPVSVSVGDLNNDGKQDLMLGIASKLGDGSGTFTTGGDPGGGLYYLNNPIADINGDGKPDAVLPSSQLSVATLQLGTGDGNFTATNPVSSGGSPWNLAVADINGDGNLDVLIRNSFPARLITRLGDGKGGFTAGPNVDFPGTPTVGDLNGDGKPDLALADEDSLVAIRLGDGAGHFTGTNTVPAASFVRGNAVAIGDLNGDDKADLVFASGTGTVHVRLGDGNGNFSGTTNVQVGSDPRSLILADLNGDGKLDFATANHADNSISVRYGDGAGGFSGTTEFALGTDPQTLAAGDINGDGRLDLIVASLSESKSIVFTGACVSPPAVSSSGADNITLNSARIKGNVDSDGGGAITERGFYWKQGTGVTGGGAGETKVAISGTTGAFTAPLGGLTPDTQYSFKAYAKNAVGTTFTSEQTFRTFKTVQIAKRFADAQIPVNGTSQLTFTISNPNPSGFMVSISFSDTMPAGLAVPDQSGTGACNGSYSVASNVVSFGGGFMSAHTSCEFSVTVTADGVATGLINNTTSGINSANFGSGAPASASITVLASATASVSGTILGPGGRPATNASVTISGPNVDQTLTTGRNGKFTFSSLPTGANYLITVAPHRGSQYDPQNVQLAADVPSLIFAPKN